MIEQPLPTTITPSEPPLCTCLLYIGDNPPCPVPGHNIAADPRTEAETDLDAWQAEWQSTYRDLR